MTWMPGFTFSEKMISAALRLALQNDIPFTNSSLTVAASEKLLGYLLFSTQYVTYSTYMAKTCGTWSDIRTYILLILGLNDIEAQHLHPELFHSVSLL